MPLLNEKLRNDIRKVLGDLPAPVTLTLFTKESCPTCADLVTLVREMGEVDPRIHARVLAFDREPAEALSFGIEDAPAIVVSGARDYGIRFYGTPGGFEFSSFLDAIRSVSHGESELPDELKRRLAALAKPVRIRVFVTPTCPYCPQAVETANHIALAARGVQAEMVEAMEFAELSDRFNVRGVPRIVINDDHAFEGAIPAQRFVEAVLEAAG
ncbi:MAG TPA: thioredoxin family protein [Terriglobales bacterium]|nr:thioredoxin family protein [Terriglobales bacterium]